MLQVGPQGRHWAPECHRFRDTGQNREPECHRFRDTGQALESSASRRLDTGWKRALECRPKACKMPPFCSRIPPNDSKSFPGAPQGVESSCYKLYLTHLMMFPPFFHSNPSFWGGTGRHWAPECHRICDTGQNREPECHRFRDTGPALGTQCHCSVRHWALKCRLK